LLDAQLTHCIGLNDLCDSLQLRAGPLSTIRGATPPSRNGLSHANRERSPAMAEKLFWRTLDHLTQQTPGFAAGQRRGPAFRFKMTYVLLRYLSHLSKWAHSFTRLFTILRAALWEKYDLLKLLACYGTAGGSFRNLARPEQAYFPGYL
jgi:hypothetical protein